MDIGASSTRTAACYSQNGDQTQTTRPAKSFFIVFAPFLLYADEQNNPGVCRGRFIAPTADLSALDALIDIHIILLKIIKEEKCERADVFFFMKVP